MKMLIYFALIVAFLMFYQTNPVFTIVIVVIALVTFFFYKSRNGKNSNSRGGIRFLSGKSPPQNDSTDDLITLMMIQQIFTSPSSTSDNVRESIQNDKTQAEESEIDKTKREVLELLGDD